MAITVNKTFFEKTTRELLVSESSLIQSNLVTKLPDIRKGAAAIATTIEPISSIGNPTDITGGTVTITPNELDAVKIYAASIYKGDAIQQSNWEDITQDIDTMFDLSTEIANKVNEDLNENFGWVLRGVFDAASMANNVYDIRSDSGTVITGPALRTARGLLGGKTSAKLKTCIMHQNVYDDLADAGLVAWTEAQDWSNKVLTTGLIPTTNGMQIIVDDLICESYADSTDTLYPTYLMDFDTLSLSPLTGLYFEEDMSGLVGGGTHYLAWYFRFALGVNGVTFNSALTGASNEAALKLGTNWTLRWNKKNVKITKLTTKSSR